MEIIDQKDKRSHTELREVLSDEGYKYTDRQWGYINQYPLDHNKTKAAIRAGFSERSAGQVASRMMKEAKIKRAIALKEKELAERVDLKACDVINELMRIAFLDISKLFNKDGTLKAIHDIDRDTLQALASVEVDQVVRKNLETQKTQTKVITSKVRTINKLPALDKLGDYLGIWSGDNDEDKEDRVIHTITEFEVQKIKKGKSG